MMPDSVEVCRLCLSKKGLMLPIFQNPVSENETPFRTKIMSCASIEIFADDELPSKVCYLCVHQVEKFFQFQTMCENSDLVLRSQLKDSKVLLEVDNDDKNVFVPQTTANEGEKCNLIPNHYSSNCFDKKLNFDTLTCNICSSMFLTNNLLIDHLIKNHPDLNLFFCKSCKVAFSHVNQFKNHLNLQHSLSCNHCDSVFKYEKSLKDHIKNHLIENLSCKFCGMTFQKVHDLKKHEHLHSEKTCSYCSKELKSKSEYDSHFKECSQKYCCKFCKQSFKVKKNLIEHVNNQHDSFELEKCDDCQDTSITEEVQEQKCESEEDQSFQCENCQTQYNDELSLINHMSTEHSGAALTCKFCAKKFGLKSSLKRHERSHSGIKPYQCKFCPRKFKDSSACVVHTRTHTGEHPFRCQECHKDFKQLANLKMHTYRHHKKNKKTVGMESEILNESANDYEHLYTGDIMENYSGENVRTYQELNETISTSFSQDINMLMPDHSVKHALRKIHSHRICRKFLFRSKQIQIKMKGIKKVP